MVGIGSERAPQHCERRALVGRHFGEDRIVLRRLGIDRGRGVAPDEFAGGRGDKDRRRRDPQRAVSARIEEKAGAATGKDDCDGELMHLRRGLPVRRRKQQSEADDKAEQDDGRCGKKAGRGSRQLPKGIGHAFGDVSVQKIAAGDCESEIEDEGRVRWPAIERDARYEIESPGKDRRRAPHRIEDRSECDDEEQM